VCGDPEEKREAIELLRPRLAALERLSWEEMDAYDEREEVAESPSGRRFRIVTGAFWDMEEWDSCMLLYAKAYSSSGWRRRFPYALWATRGALEPIPAPPADWTPSS
jgi:hypothetical protein